MMEESVYSSQEETGEPPVWIIADMSMPEGAASVQGYPFFGAEASLTNGQWKWIFDTFEQAGASGICLVETGSHRKDILNLMEYLEQKSRGEHAGADWDDAEGWEPIRVKKIVWEPGNGQEFPWNELAEASEAEDGLVSVMRVDRQGNLCLWEEEADLVGESQESLVVGNLMEEDLETLWERIEDLEV